MVGDTEHQLTCGRLFINLCMGINKLRGGWGNLPIAGKNGPSQNKIEALNPLKSSRPSDYHYILDYIHSVILDLKKSQSSLTPSQSLQIHLTTSLHNLFQDDFSDPLQLILDVSSYEPNPHFPDLPIGSQPLLDAHRCNLLMSRASLHFRTYISIKLLREVGLGQSIIDQLEDKQSLLQFQIKELLKTYKRHL